jgi:hypothetical protein
MCHDHHQGPLIHAPHAGTGKTTVASRVGQLFESLDLLQGSQVCPVGNGALLQTVPTRWSDCTQMYTLSHQHRSLLYMSASHTTVGDSTV